MTTSLGSVELAEIIARYTRDYVEHSSVVEPLPGQQYINPGEEFTVRLTATNDPNFAGSGTAGVRLVNVRWHLRVINTSVVNIVVPAPPLESRTEATDDLPLLTPGDHVSELYVFPRFGRSVLDPGETNNMVINGIALDVGTILIMFDVVADVDLEWIGLAGQNTNPLASLGTASVTT